VGRTLDNAVDLAPTVARAVDGMEAEGRLPAELASELAAADLMRMGVAEAVGGPEVAPVEQLDVIEALAAANPAAAWCVMISSTTALMSGWLGLDDAVHVFGDPVGIWAGGVAPSGTLAATDGGYLLDGRWTFGSGSQNATWFTGGASTPEADYRLCAVPAADVTIHEHWDVVGLAGTGSHDWSVTEAVVPAGRTVDLFGGSPVSDRPLYQMGLFGPLAAAIAAVGLGAARASIDALVDLAGAKTPTFAARTLATRSTVQAATSRADASLVAAGLYLRSCIDAAYATASTGGTVDVALKAATRRAAVHAADVSADVAASMFRLAGGTAVRNDAPFGRLLRDTQVVNQHLMVAPAIWELTGQVLFGLPVDRPDL
jgi:alkylation response protein AidB-like acyl-CoA dehydrogenase